MAIKKKREIKYQDKEFKEQIEEEGLLDSYIKLCQKIKVPPHIGVINFVFLVILVFSTIFVYTKQNLYSLVVFVATLGFFTFTNLYVYKKEKELNSFSK